MANFYKDNADLRFYFERYLDWEPIVRLTEGGFAQPEGHARLEEACEFYRDIVEMIGQYAADEIAPHWEVIDRQVPQLVDGEVVLPDVLDRIYSQLSDLGIHGLCVPRELGGMNAPLLVYMTNVELFSRADVGVVTHVGFHCGIAMALMVYAALEGSVEVDTETKRITSTRFDSEIGEIIAGKAWGSMDITEPNAGSDMAALRARAEVDEDGVWRLTGQKIFITSGHGKYHIVIARSEDDASLGLDGLSLFLVKLFDEEDTIFSCDLLTSGSDKP